MLSSSGDVGLQCVGGSFLPVASDADIEVWLVSAAMHEKHAAFIDSMLSDAERHRARRLREQAQARLWKCVRASLRLRLASVLDTDPASLEFSYGSYGKPYCGSLAFNVSHSGDTGVIALSKCKHVRHRIGIDIEAVKPQRDHLELSRLVFNEQEQRELASMEMDERASAFVRAWTRKEAWLKAQGLGLGFGMSRVHVGIAETPERVSVDGVADRESTLHEPAEVDGYRLSICVTRMNNAPHA